MWGARDGERESANRGIPARVDAVTAIVGVSRAFGCEADGGRRSKTTSRTHARTPSSCPSRYSSLSFTSVRCRCPRVAAKRSPSLNPPPLLRAPGEAPASPPCHSVSCTASARSTRTPRVRSDAHLFRLPQRDGGAPRPALQSLGRSTSLSSPTPAKRSGSGATGQA